jgi:hypothetical protein
MPSAAERQKRYRLHRKGDHRLCDPARRCEEQEVRETAEAVATLATQDVQPGRGPRGAALWAAMADVELGPMHRMLLDQLCRAVDRLDRFEASLANKRTWMRFEVDDAGGSVVVVVDNVVAEIRQLEATVKTLVAEIKSGLPKETAKSPVTPSRKGGGLSDLTARIAARRDGAAG